MYQPNPYDYEMELTLPVFRWVEQVASRLNATPGCGLCRFCKH